MEATAVETIVLAFTHEMEQSIRAAGLLSVQLNADGTYSLSDGTNGTWSATATTLTVKAEEAPIFNLAYTIRRYSVDIEYWTGGVHDVGYIEYGTCGVGRIGTIHKRVVPRTIVQDY